MAIFTTSPTKAPLTADVVLEDFGQSSVYRGRTAVLSVLQTYFASGFTNGQMHITTTLSDQKTTVIAFTFCGRQEGKFLGIPATNREVAVPMILLFRVSQDQISHIAWYYDAGTILRQLGLTQT